MNPFDQPHDAGVNDQFFAYDEMGNTIMRTASGQLYIPNPMAAKAGMTMGEFWERSDNLRRPEQENSPMNALGAVAGMIANGYTAPGRALSGEPVTLGDVWDTAGTAVLGGAAMPKPAGTLGANSFRAYHGSPHDFDKFDMSKIGTGEGAQAYGHGLYFADNETIARTYRDKVSAMRGMGDLTVDGRKIDWSNPKEAAAFEVMRHGGDREAAATFYERTFKGSAVPAIIRSGEPLPDVQSPGSMYEVQINADPDTFLDWDKPLSEQPQAVRDAVQGIADLRGDSGGYIWDSVVRQMNADGAIGEHMADVAPAIKTGPKAATEALREAGIPGIKYLEAGSRVSGDGSRNYVVFDDALIEILRKYGLAGLGLGGAMMMQPDQAQASEKNALSGYLRSVGLE